MNDTEIMSGTTLAVRVVRVKANTWGVNLQGAGLTLDQVRRLVDRLVRERGVAWVQASHAQALVGLEVRAQRKEAQRELVTKVLERVLRSFDIEAEVQFPDKVSRGERKLRRVIKDLMR